VPAASHSIPTSASLSLRTTSFSHARLLAPTVDSLVRVSRRADHAHFASSLLLQPHSPCSLQVARSHRHLFNHTPRCLTLTWSMTPALHVLALRESRHCSLGAGCPLVTTRWPGPGLNPLPCLTDFAPPTRSQLSTPLAAGGADPLCRASSSSRAGCLALSWPARRYHVTVSCHMRHHQALASPLGAITSPWASSGTFHTLLRVLFIFPSRYLFAIGLLPLFCLGWSLPPSLGLHSQANRLDGALAAPSRFLPTVWHDVPCYGALTLSGALFQGTCKNMPSSAPRCLAAATRTPAGPDPLITDRSNLGPICAPTLYNSGPPSSGPSPRIRSMGSSHFTRSYYGNPC